MFVKSSISLLHEKQEAVIIGDNITIWLDHVKTRRCASNERCSLDVEYVVSIDGESVNLKYVNYETNMFYFSNFISCSIPISIG